MSAIRWAWGVPVPMAEAVSAGFFVLATVAFALGSSALARAEDLRALYWLVVGLVSVRAAVSVVRPGAKP